MVINSIQWKILYDKFTEFAYLARQYNFYNEEVDKMENSLFEMCPIPQIKGNAPKSYSRDRSIFTNEF